MLYKLRFKSAASLRQLGHWRMARLATAIVLLIAAVLPLLNVINQLNAYALSPAEKQVVGAANHNLNTKFSFNKQNMAWEFNAEGVALQAKQVQELAGSNEASDASFASLKAQVGGASKNSQSLYSVSLPVEASQGVSYFDNNSGLSFKMVPKFSMRDGKKTDSRIIYPLSKGGKLVYTAKNNGFKEDIVLEEAIGDELSFDYQLELPKTLEARLLPSGGIGIYSADPVLFGDISYGDDSDQAKIVDARQNAEKDHLVFAIPAPVINDQTGLVANVHYELKGNDLQVKASGLSDLQYPISVDPSVVVTSTSDFSDGNNEGNIAFDDGQVKRAGLTGGITESWQSTTALPDPVESGATVVYDGWLYSLGGADIGVANRNEVWAAPINSDGSLGNWQSAGPDLPASRNQFAYAVYGGYIYLFGGSATIQDGVSAIYAPIIEGGQTGDWQETTDLPKPYRIDDNAVAYDNRIYIVGGGDNGADGTFYDDVYYADIKADGSLGDWQATTSLPRSTSLMTTEVYNGYIYAMQGVYDSASPKFSSAVYYAKITNDGGVGEWQTANSFSGARYGAVTAVSHGYIYLLGGWSGGSNYRNDVQYAAILADGSLGDWRTSPSFATARVYATGVATGDYLYILGGRDLRGPIHDTAAVEYTKIKPAGTIVDYQSTTGMGSAAESTTGSRAVVYNGCIYNVGGYYWSGGNQYVDSVAYASINSDGTLGSWTESPNRLSAGVSAPGLATYGGYLYVVGGYNSGISSTVQYAELSSSGCGVGAWQTNSTGYVHAVGAQPLVAYNGYLYQFGAMNAGASNEIYSAPINSDASVGSWSQQPNVATARTKGAMVAYGGYMYLVGGLDSSGSSLASVEYAKITGPGTLGPWQTASTNLATARSDFGLIARNGYLYVVGGQGASGELASIEFAAVKAGGSLGAWQANTSMSNTWITGGIATSGDKIYLTGGRLDGSRTDAVEMMTINNGGSGQIDSWQASGSITACFPSGIVYAGTASYNGYLYIVGGSDGGSTYYSTVCYAPIEGDGSLGTWSSTSSLNVARGRFGLEVFNGYIYAFGYDNSVEYAKVNEDGSLGSWQMTANSIPYSGYSGESGYTLYGGYIYALGGVTANTPIDAIYYAKINSDGSVGNWQANPTNLPSATGNSSVVAVDGYMYSIVGSYASDGREQVASAPINSDGSIGSWSNVTSLPMKLLLSSVQVSNGYVYLIGGITVNGPINDILYAPLLSGGRLGQWQHTISLPTSQIMPQSIVADGVIYSLGGYLNSDTYHASLNGIARAGRYSKTINLGGSSVVNSISYSGSLSDDSSVSYQIAGPSGLFNQAAKRATPQVASPDLTCPVGGQQYVKLIVNFDDRRSATFPDSGSSQVSDITVDYGVTLRSPPDKRLRGGKWFYGQQLQPLDACGP